MRSRDCASWLLAAAIVGVLVAGCGKESTKPENKAATINALVALPDTVVPGHAVTVECVATDPEGDSLTYTWTAPDGFITGTGPIVGWTAPTACGAYSISVTVHDEGGHSTTRAVSVSAACSDGTLLAGSNTGLKAVHLDGNHFLVSDNLQGQTEVVGVHIFTRSAGRTLAEIDYQGATLRSIPIPAVIPYPYKFVAIPDGRFAHLDNDNDRIDFTDAQGNFICTVPMPDPSPEELQCAYGIVVGNRLIVSETGTRKLIQVDLTSYQASIFRDLSDYSTSWLGAIDYYDGVYYLCTYNKVLRFTESGAIEEVATFTKNNLVGLAVVDGYAYVIINCYPSEVDRIDLQTMTAEPIAADLGYPESFAYIPVNLTPPITR